MNFGLKGKNAVVSGSTAGIGLAIATALAAERATVVVNGRTEGRVNSALEKIRQHHKTAELQGVAADLGTAAGIETFVKQVPHADILINNLGIFEPKPFAEIPDADWLRFFEVNVLSGIRLSRHYLPGMLKNNWGRIIFISSESAFQIPAEMVHYGMTKTAQVAVARGLAESVAGTGVRSTPSSPAPPPLKASRASLRASPNSAASPRLRSKRNSSKAPAPARFSSASRHRKKSPPSSPSSPATNPPPSTAHPSAPKAA